MNDMDVHEKYSTSLITREMHIKLWWDIAKMAKNF